MNAVVVLDSQWGPLARAIAPRFFTINERNHTGKRLHGWLAAQYPQFVVTNACPGIVDHATKHGTPSKEWLGENMRYLKKRLNPELVLVCGAVARATYDRADVDGSRIIELPHPAARTWSKQGIELVANVILDVGKLYPGAARIVRLPTGLFQASPMP